MQRKRFENYVSAQELRLLSLQRRVAWAAAVCQQVLDLYSPHFREKYGQQEALEMAWTFVAGGRIDDRRRLDVIHCIDELRQESETEGYGIDRPLFGILLLEAIGRDDMTSLGAVDYATLAFSAYQLHRQGISPFDPVVPQEYSGSLSDAAYRLARELYDFLKTCPDGSVSRDLASHLRLDLSLEPLDAAARARCRLHPPAQELEYLGFTPGKH
jgi:hypothetical protein